MNAQVESRRDEKRGEVILLCFDPKASRLRGAVRRWKAKAKYWIVQKTLLSVTGRRTVLLILMLVKAVQ